MPVGWLVDMGWWLGDPLASLSCSSGLGFLKTLMGVGGVVGWGGGAMVGVRGSEGGQ